jgi:hypothetical protein
MFCLDFGRSKIVKETHGERTQLIRKLDVKGFIGNMRLPLNG